MRYLESGSTDPAFNLALEQYAFDTLSPDGEVFMLWQNRDCVIVGLHQNTEEEINRGFIDKNNIPVIRRLSGGGAVFHDLGNLNFTFITNEPDIDRLSFDRSRRHIADALSALGVPVKFSGRNDMTVDGKKFSGSARYFRDGRLMHHGTLLFDSDLEKMSEALRVSDDKLVSKGIKSIRSRVTNLSGYTNMTAAEFQAFLRESVAGDMPAYTLSERDCEAVGAIRRERYSSWDWNYGHSPEFSVIKRRRIDGFGAIRIRMSAENGKITDFATDGDYFGSRPYSDVASALRGVRLERNALLDALRGIALWEYYDGLAADELAGLILE